MKNYQKAMPLVSHLSTTKNTWKPCKLCRGTRYAYIRSKMSNTLTFKDCPSCNGEGIKYGQDV